MTDDKYRAPESMTLEGRVFRPATLAELAEAVEQAFDYRGDVTLDLTSGIKIEGYVFNRYPSSPRPFLQLFPKQGSGTIEIPYADVTAITFTGKDTASGKSWEAWVAKKESQRRVEAAQSEAAAKARGHL